MDKEIKNIPGLGHRGELPQEKEALPTVESFKLPATSHKEPKDAQQLDRLLAQAAHHSAFSEAKELSGVLGFFAAASPKLKEALLNNPEELKKALGAVTINALGDEVDKWASRS